MDALAHGLVVEELTRVLGVGHSIVGCEAGAGGQRERGLTRSDNTSVAGLRQLFSVQVLVADHCSCLSHIAEAHTGTRFLISESSGQRGHRPSGSMLAVLGSTFRPAALATDANPSPSQQRANSAAGIRRRADQLDH